MSTKVHTAGNGRSRPLKLILMPGRVNDITQAVELILVPVDTTAAWSRRE